MEWKKYQAVDNKEKRNYFKGKVLYNDTLHSHFGQKPTPLLCKFNGAIVDRIIGDMFFHLDDQGGISHLNALNLFKRNEGTTC